MTPSRRTAKSERKARRAARAVDFNALPPVIHLTSLGCEKNTVDSERLLATLLEAGCLLAEDPLDADVLLVNTCGFIQDARDEAAEILAALRGVNADGRRRTIIALGCLAKRAAVSPDLAGALADADLRIDFSGYDAIADAVFKAAGRTPNADIDRATPFNERPRLPTGSPHSAWLKIAEGCSTGCGFCSIPLIRGPHRDIPFDAIINEAIQLADAGAVEINVIAQDTTQYGLDIDGRPRLAELLAALDAALPEPVWIRLLYAYPKRLTDDILDTLAGRPSRFCAYLDMPFQHIADPVLAAMNRRTTRSEMLATLERVRRRLPDAALRTSLVVGHPGETDSAFEELLEFVASGAFDLVGAFEYSPEPGTLSAKLGDDIPATVKAERRDRLMGAAQAVSKARLQAMIGRRQTILLDMALDKATGRATLDALRRSGLIEKSAGREPGEIWLGRSQYEAPEIDGRVIVLPSKGRSVGEFVDVDMIAATEYDRIGCIAR